jgi:putative ABC transport system permease protein
VVSPLVKKLLRDLKDLKGPILTIGVVVACGVSAFVSLTGTHRALLEARTRYYAESRMGDVFATAERVPNTLASQLASLPGVSRIETRVSAVARIPMPTLRTPADAFAISIPREGPARLGDLEITHGRRPHPGHHDELVVLEAFANAHDIGPGDPITVVIEGQEREMRVVGTATSPEWVFAILPGNIAADPERIAVVWMARDTLEAITGFEGAFNDVVLELQAHANEDEIVAQVDRLLDPYGGPGAYGRDRQSSNYYLEQEMQQVQGIATVAPVLFLSVAAFLLHVVLGRIVTLQRGVIATLKAVGYTDTRIALHYLQLVLVIVTLGAFLGLALGAVMGDALTSLYLDFIRLPRLRFRMPTDIAAASVLTSLFAGVMGGLGAVRSILEMTPAEAMQPPSPPSYRGGSRMSAWARVLVSPSLRIVVRELLRQPIRSLLSVIGVAVSVGLLVLGASLTDSMDALLDEYLPSVQREDITVGMRAPVTIESLASFRAIDGVRRADGLRALPVRLEAGAHSRTVAILGYPDDQVLRPLRDLDGRVVPVPAQGVVLTDILAERLGVKPGDHVRAVVLEGERRELPILVVGTVREAMGMAGHMNLAELHRLLREPESISQALLVVDPRAEREVLARIDEMPAVASAGNVKETLRKFADQSGESIAIMALVITLFGAAITIGVIYNNARITLNSRQRDLASMRVLGFTQREIGGVLLGELVAQVVLALPLGLWFGHLMLSALYADVDPEAFRLPARIDPSSYATGAVITVLAALAAGWIVRRRLDALDLIGVLKTRE